MIRTKYLELQKYAFSFVYALVVCNNDLRTIMET